MAEDDDTPAAETTGQRQKRPPVTIDLEAEAVEPAAPSAPPPASEPETASSPPPPAAGTDTPLRRALPLAAAAVVGGLIGGGVAALLFAPQTDTIGAASIDSRFATLSSRIDALEAKKEADAGAAVQPAIDPARIAALEAGLARLESAPASSPAVAPDLQPLEQRLAALEARPEAVPAPAIDLKPLEDRLAALDARVGTIEQNPPADPATEAAARVIALTALRQAALGDKPFEAELAAFRALGGDSPPLQTLGPLAAAGAPSLAALKAAFPAVAEAIRTAARRIDPESGLFDRLAASAGSLVSVKPTGPVEGGSATAIVSRMEADVEKGDLAAALAESGALDEGAKSALAAWAEAARRRLAIDGALAALADGN